MQSITFPAAAASASQPLYEQYRPDSWSDVIAQDKAITKIRTVARRGIGGKVFWISGQSGTGKTTIARLIGQEIADRGNIEEYDATAMTVADLRDLDRRMHYYGLGDRPGRAFIINEAHGLRADVIRSLLIITEPPPPHVVVIFTTTVEGEQHLIDTCDDFKPLLARCINVALARRDLAKGFAERARAIAQSEGLDGRPIESYLRLAKDCGNNFRAMLQEIEAGAMLVEAPTTPPRECEICTATLPKDCPTEICASCLNEGKYD